MSAEADRIFVLEDALVEAFNLAEFLCHCLTSDDYEHAYPQMTREKLDKLRPVVPSRLMCVHSGTVAGCDSCAERNALFARRAEIERKALLGRAERRLGKRDET